LKRSDQQAYVNLTSISQCSSKTRIRIPHAILRKNDRDLENASEQKSNLMRPDKGRPAPRDYAKMKSDRSCRPRRHRRQAC